MIDFFRRCPECGRRFHIKVVRREPVKALEERIPTKKVQRMGLSGYKGWDTMPHITLQEGPPVVVYREEFRYVYKCKRCGHEWSEKHVEKHRAG